ncbi:hypothetical protein QFC21_004783 [Naganishia friedmannii]|uniref:Uncharacterized protein n=1 Tax=Naganishia friedmannii TaxID=89922 RepID=A0ACC2VF60_9TREE|nr:hypothetical protein QFC21_004783 [Naganishia friedmannii]
MEWPDSVHIDTLSTHKTARKLRSRNPEGIDKRYSAGQREEYRRRQRDAHPFVPSGVVLNAGERGAAILKSFRDDGEHPGKRRNGKQPVPRQRWDWEFANATRPERPLRFSQEAAVFYPPTIQVSESVTVDENAKPRTLDLQPSRRSAAARSLRRTVKPNPREGSASSNGPSGTPSDDPEAEEKETAATGGLTNGEAESQEDEEEDEQMIPADQRQSPTPTPGAVRPDDTAPELAVRSADNRSPLATIRYAAKAKAPDKVGFETFEICYLVFPMGAGGNQLTVRTETLLYYLLVTPIPHTPFPVRQSAGSPVARVELLSLVDFAGLEGARAVDIAMHPEHFQQCLITTDAGVLYKWNIVRSRTSELLGWVHEGKLMRIMQVPEEEKFAAAPDFYRAVWGSRNDSVLLMNATHVWFLDIEGPELVVNTIDISHTTTLFTSIDPTGAERDAEYLCLSTTDAVMWLDARDDSNGETVYLVRSLENRKATLLHVRESIEGIHSRRDPYDILLPGEEGLVGKAPSASTARQMTGFSSMHIQDAPTPLSLLLFLEDDGKLSCSLQQPTRGLQVAGAEALGTNVKGQSDGSAPITPDRLILRRHQIDMDDDQLEEDMIDGGILQDMFPPEEESGEDDEDYASDIKYKKIQTRELWQNHDNHGAQSDPFKSYTLRLSRDRAEKQVELQDLLEKLHGVLDRSDLRISQCQDSIHKITGEISLASSPNTGLEALEQGYLGGIDVYSPDEPLGRVHQRQQDATFRLLCDLQLSATTLTSSTNDNEQQADKAINISETLSRLSFSPPSKSTVPRTTLLKPISTTECLDTNSASIQALSSQWEIGSDPIHYVWPGKSNHRALHAEEDLPASLPQPPVRKPSSIVPAFKLPRQSALITSSPALHPLFTPNSGSGESWPMPSTPSQVQFEGDSQRHSKDFASSQVMQGPFGGRNGASFRRSLGGKKRTIGF